MMRDSRTDFIGARVSSYLPSRLYREWDYRRGLYGVQSPAAFLPFLYLADVARWGTLGHYIWRSRSIRGWTRGEEAVRLGEAAFALPEHAIILEIGSFLGCSATILAGARKLKGSGRVHCIDPFDGSGDAFSTPVYRTILRREPRPQRRAFEQNLARAGVLQWVTIHPMPAQQAVETWQLPIDLLFLDGHQSYEVVAATFEQWMPFLKKGGVLAVHNARPGYRQESHDGSSRIVEEWVHPPQFDNVRWVRSMCLARKSQ